jgi:DNA-binding transcriptional regulator YhcF (GntR family)
VDDLSDALTQPLDRSGEVPVGAQLTWRLRMLIASGALKPGDRLPSARELARAVGVNVNTIFAVYGRLEGEGLIQTQHGRGSSVVGLPPNAAELAGLARRTASAARAAGLDPRDIAMGLFANQGLPEVQPGEPVANHVTPDVAPAAHEAAERRRLREEINLLELELVRLEPLAPAADPATRARGRAEPRILDAASLRAVRDGLQSRVAALTIAAEQRKAAAEARRRSRATTTLDRPGFPRTRAKQQTSHRPESRSPIVVRWTPHWGTA